MARRTKDEALATRNRILDCAEQVFCERGVSRTSLQDLAQAAGVTRGAIYWHFKDKADVFNAMMERVCLPLESTDAHFDAAVVADPLGALRSTLRDLFARLARDIGAQRVIEIATQKVEYVDELQKVRERRLESCRRYQGMTERALRQAKVLGLCRSAFSPKTLAIGLHALVDGLIANWILDPAAFNLERVGRDVIDHYLAGLTVKAA